MWSPARGTARVRTLCAGPCSLKLVASRKSGVSGFAQVFFRKVVEQARAKDILSDEHFTVDGTLIEAWAGQKSFQRKDAPPPPPEDGGSNPTVNFHDEKRSNQTHQSTSDPEAMLYKKSRGSESKLSCLGHVLMENRNGLVVDTRLTRATGTAEREAALEMAVRIPGGSKRVTLGADRAYDTADLVEQIREFRVKPHVAQNDTHRLSDIDARTTSQPGYTVSQRKVRHFSRQAWRLGFCERIPICLRYFCPRPLFQDHLVERGL
jgi:hypothetical protein